MIKWHKTVKNVKEFIAVPFMGWKDYLLKEGFSQNNQQISISDFPGKYKAMITSINK
ncbi:hypothetical protein [Mucilaginibacter sp. SP1R1]|uniref:hypothetical protein n=1 Tax=Mucilaginibacter sp. SP1R1 TaxID=2723091 RepID=UPI00160E90A8|nr:hypothetical protein [Mucilaginibacter sp. SP1R1]MBB6148057.1 hypothetical protein [Mucilaginibacter sp. SP1R1]